MRSKLPLPTIERLCTLYGYLSTAREEGSIRLSSRELGRRIGESSHTVRKDLNHLHLSDANSAGYAIDELHETIAETLDLKRPKKACIVGLGRLGQAILRYTDFTAEGIDIRAGFDSDTNRLELLSAPIPLLPSHAIAAKVKREGICLAVLAVPPAGAQLAADRLVEGGIRGIVNFTIPVTVPETVRVRQISVLDELRILSALEE